MKKDRIIAVLLVLFSLLIAYYSFQLPASTMEGEPGSAFFPFILLALLILCSVGLFFSRPVKKPALTEEQRREYEDLGLDLTDEAEKSQAQSLVEGLLLYGFFFIGIIVMYLFGFIAGITVGISGMLVFIGWKVPRALIFSLITACIIFLIFNTLLHVTLPSGKLL
ncbi:MAG: tripartite tricarboxylate transporter TctB family protein [Gracilibacteraceae bacterium]|jgi:hypothetical protein|nr:tripartite tricarboxylate transporter TctB family protein [Gracilibacteraceae bacterium]